MEEKYIVYYRGSGKSLFESSYLDSAERFVSKLESENIRNGRPYEEKYEITKVKRPKLLK